MENKYPDPIDYPLFTDVKLNEVECLPPNMHEVINYFEIIHDIYLFDPQLLIQLLRLNEIKKADTKTKASPELTRALALSHAFYYYVFFFYNNNKVKKNIKKVWVECQIIKEIKKRYTIIEKEIFQLLIKYREGKKQKLYKNMKSFKKELSCYNIDSDEFKRLYSVYTGYMRAFDKKMGKKH